MPERTGLYDLTHDQLAELLAGWGEPHFRAEQVWRWLYQALADRADSMTNLPAALRSRLDTETDLRLLTPLMERASASGHTRKVLLALRDGVPIESVLMGYESRRTACISSQAGCGLGCVFCATGQGGLVRNLTAGEIVGQVMYFARQVRDGQAQSAIGRAGQTQRSGHPITNVVFMGMGEPLANYAATWQAIETLTDSQGFNLGARRITLSTVGLVPGIRRMAGEALPVNLAVSLHAADDTLRNQLVPINRRYPLVELLAAVRRYIEMTQRRVTFEYALISGVNDSAEQSGQLSGLLRGVQCHVNLIPLNPTVGSPLQPSPREAVAAFRERLESTGIPVTVRLRRGIEIEAGCGQLRQRHSDSPDNKKESPAARQDAGKKRSTVEVPPGRTDIAA